MVCSFAQAAGRVNMGVKVLVWVSFHAPLCFGVHAGLLDAGLYP